MTRVRHARLEEGGLEQPRVVAAHHPRRRYGRQIHGPLMLAPGAERLPEAEQDESAHQQRPEGAEEQQRRLPALAGPADGRLPPATRWGSTIPPTALPLNAPLEQIRDISSAVTWRGLMATSMPPRS